MRFSVECAFPHLGKRGGTSWKSALWTGDVTENRTLWLHLMEKRTLDGRRDGKPHSAAAPHQKVHSVCGQSRRMRFSVRVRSQNALFRRMRFSSPGQTRRHLTEKRILCRRLTEKRTLDGRRDGKPHSVPAPHEKAHFGPRPQIAPHGKTALCVLCMLCAASHRVSDLSLG